jgi:hypothetical protein
MDFDLFKKTFFPFRDINGGLPQSVNRAQSRSNELLEGKDQRESSIVITNKLRLLED